MHRALAGHELCSTGGAGWRTHQLPPPFPPSGVPEGHLQVLAGAALHRLHQQLHQVVPHQQPHAHAALQAQARRSWAGGLDQRLSQPLTSCNVSAAGAGPEGLTNAFPNSRAARQRWTVATGCDQQRRQQLCAEPSRAVLDGHAGCRHRRPRLAHAWRSVAAGRRAGAHAHLRRVSHHREAVVPRFSQHIPAGAGADCSIAGRRWRRAQRSRCLRRTKVMQAAKPDSTAHPTLRGLAGSPLGRSQGSNSACGLLRDKPSSAP